jgi:hypothetical protein
MMTSRSLICPLKNQNGGKLQKNNFNSLTRTFTKKKNLEKLLLLMSFVIHIPVKINVLIYLLHAVYCYHNCFLLFYKFRKTCSITTAI